MKRLFHLVLLAACAVFVAGTAKNLEAALVLKAGSVTAGSGTVVTVPVIVTNFSDVVTFQFSIEWDPAVLQFVGTGEYGVSLAAGNFANVLPGKLAVSWDDVDFTGKTLSDGSKLFSVQFTALAANGTSSTIVISGTPTPIEITDVDGNILQSDLQSGLVTVAKQNPVLTWTNPADISFGTALSSAQLNAVANVSGTFVYSPAEGTLFSAGLQQTLSVTFTPNDTANYNPATASVLVNVLPAGQTITFAALANKVFGDAPFSVSATADSGLAVSFSIVSGPATLSGNTVTITGAGTVTIRAAQSGSANYNAAANVDQAFTVGKSGQTITFGALANKVFGDAPFSVSATADSGLAVSFSIVSGPATLSGNTVTITGAGTVTIRAAQSGSANYNAAANVDQSFTLGKAGQTITFGALANKVFGEAPFSVSATADSGLAVSFSILSGPATLSGNTVTITGAGTVTVRAAQSGSANYNAAANVDQAFTVGKSGQTITFGALANKVFGDAPFSVSATADSGLAVSFSILSGPATLSGNTVTITGAGTVTVRAAQSGSANYNAAANVDQSFTVGKAGQTITFAALANKVFGDAPFAVSATADSGLAVSFSILSGPATLSGNTVTITGAGTVTVRAAQSGNGNYNAAANVDQSFTIGKAGQTITFGALANKVFGDAPFSVSATADSGLAVSFSIVSGPATLSGNTVTITGAGTVTVRAAQSGNGNYNAAANVDQSFTVGKAGQTITFAALANKVIGDAPFAVSATADSGLAVSFSIVSGPATLSGNTVTITGAGTVTVRAAQSGNGNYNAAANVDQSFTVGKASQTITFAALANKVFGDAPFSVNATADSGLAVSFSIVSGPGTLSGNTVTITGAGIVTVRAAQSGSANYNAAANVDQAFTVNKAGQTITFAALANKVFGDAPFGVSATADSGLAVSFSILSGPATLSGNTVTITGAGTVTVRAAQSGSVNYNAAANVDQAFTVNKAGQTITFAALANKVFGDAPFAVSAIADSGLAVSFSIVSGPATLSGNTVTITGAGTVTVRATQSGSANYNAAANVDQSFTVGKSSPVLTWSQPTGIVYGTALSLAAQLNASANVPGTFTYTPAAGTVLGAGNNQTLRVDFVPQDAANYQNASTSVTLSVAKAPLTITADNKSKVVDAPIPTLTAQYNGLVNGDTASALTVPVSLATTAIASSLAGSYLITASGATSANYQITFVNGTLTVTDKLIPVLTWSTPADITLGTTLGASQLNATADVPGTFSYTPGTGALLSFGSQQTLTTVFTPTDAANYAVKSVSVLLNVTAARFAGRVSYYAGQRAVPGVTVDLTGDATVTKTAADDGTFSITNNKGGVYTLRPSKATDASPATGVTTVDISLIRKHILLRTLLDSPYKVMAADVNNSGTITTTDISLVRQLVLGVLGSFTGGMWKFVPSDYVFPDALAPWTAPAERDYNNVSGDALGQDFVAVHMGDVNGSWTPPGTVNGLSIGLVAASGTPVRLSLGGSLPVVSGSSIIIPVTVSAVKALMTAQFTLKWDQHVFAFVGVSNFRLRGLSQDNFAVGQGDGTLTMSWDDPNSEGVDLTESEQLFALEFRAIGPVGAKSGLLFSDKPTAREFSTASGVVSLNTGDGTLTIAQSPLTLTLSPLNAKPQIQIGGAELLGKSYILEATESLAAPNWKPLYEGVGNGNGEMFEDPTPLAGERYYRLRLR